MTTPWPADVLDCAKRLAKSLGYEDDQIRVDDGRVHVYRQVDWATPDHNPFFWYWHILDPRVSTVWSALIGINGILSIDLLYSGNFIACNHKGFVAVSADIGIAVCEAYNMLKGNPRGKANPPQKFSDGGLRRDFSWSKV